MKTPEPSEFMKQVERAVEIGAENVQIHHCSLLPQTTQELQLMVESCVYADLKLSSQVLLLFFIFYLYFLPKPMQAIASVSEINDVL